MISSHVKIRYPHMWRYRWFHWHQACLSLKLCLNSLVSHRNIFGSSSKVFGHLRKFSEILGKCSATFVWPSEQFWKIFGNLQNMVGNQKRRHHYVYIMKSTWHVSSKIWILCSSGKNNKLTRSLRSIVRYCSCHSNIKLLSSRHLVISSIYFLWGGRRQLAAGINLPRGIDLNSSPVIT